METYLGERMSGNIDLDKVVFDVRGDAYEDLIHRLMHRPLDTGRLLYVKLRNSFPEQVGVEIWWNHFHNVITVQIDGNYITFFKDEQRARLEHLFYIDDLVRRVKEECQQ